MAEEIQEAVQIIKVTYDGIEIAMKIGSGGLAAAQQVVDSLVHLLNREKAMGKTSIRKLLLRGGDLQVFQFKEEDLKQVEKLLKKYGVLYSVLPDRNKEDGKKEILFPSEAVPRVNLIARKLMDARIGNYGEYLDGTVGKGSLTQGEGKPVDPMLMNLFEKTGILATEKKEITAEDIIKAFEIETTEAEKLLAQLEKAGVIRKQADEKTYTALVSKEEFEKKMEYYRELAFKIRVAEKSQHPELLDITISDTLIAGTREDAVKTRVPGTWGENVRYLWTARTDILEIHDGKTMLTFLDPDKEYQLYDASDQVVEVKRGQELYDRHYDEVSAKVRERYEQMERQEKERSKPKDRGQNKGTQRSKTPKRDTRRR
ncbi:MAG: PcfB family protein [Tyzzerella sp.]|nr:PcfB family protein [Tyzzerella sp.]